MNRRVIRFVIGAVMAALEGWLGSESVVLADPGAPAL